MQVGSNKAIEKPSSLLETGQAELLVFCSC